MVACAAYAEMLMLLTEALKMDGPTASAVISDLLRRRGVTGFGTPNTLDMLPAGESKSATPVVLLARSVRQEALRTDQAREAAGQWLEVAEAAESDQLVLEAAHAVIGIDAEQEERLFAYLRALRDQESPAAGDTPD